jgi:hypothetical protein
MNTVGRWLINPDPYGHNGTHLIGGAPHLLVDLSDRQVQADDFVVHQKLWGKVTF